MGNRLRLKPLRKRLTSAQQQRRFKRLIRREATQAMRTLEREGRGQS